MEAVIRLAITNDARAIAEVHVESSKSTYAGIFSEAHLNNFSVGNRERFWRDLLSSPELNSITMVGCDASGRVVGFISGGKERTGPSGCKGEIYVVYLLRSAQRQGLGTRLVRHLVGELLDRGCVVPGEADCQSAAG